MAQDFNFSTPEVEACGSLEFKPSLVYRGSSRIARTSQKVSVSKTKTRKDKNLSYHTTTQQKEKSSKSKRKSQRSTHSHHQESNKNTKLITILHMQRIM